MRTTSILSTFGALLLATAVVAQFPKSAKRGLVSVGTNNPQDNQLWVQPGNGLTWYWNYGKNVTAAYSNISQSDLEFVPMQWGVTNTTGNSFVRNITALIAQGRNITHVLGFNEPDVNITEGGSQVSPAAAASSWILNFDPLSKMGIKVGAPVVYANASGFAWLDKFYSACQSRNSNCTADFMNIHFFGNISSLESYLTEYKKRYPGIPLWITEFALNYAPLAATELFFNQSISLFDKDPDVERYSYFGSFRASASNVGWNATMLDGAGKLRDIGSWYLGGAKVATTTTSTSVPSATSTKSSDAGLSRGGVVGSVVGAAAAALLLLS